jgi:hypothetical protein
VRPFVLLSVGLLLLSTLSWDGTGTPPDEKATAAVYVYEKDDHVIPAYVTVAINRLNRERKIVATLFEDDTTDGAGDVPDQYRAALDAARKAGLPAVVAMAGETVLRVTSSPVDEKAVMEAVP